MLQEPYRVQSLRGILQTREFQYEPLDEFARRDPVEPPLVGSSWRNSDCIPQRLDSRSSEARKILPAPV
jgi:hypothetical protein